MLSVIMKLTNACNLRCSYCSLGKKINPCFIGKDTAEKAVDFISYTAEKKSLHEVSVIFHGGEPTLLGVDFYKHIISYAKTHSSVKFLWKLQTNGYSISDELIDLFKANDFCIGVSFDGNEDSHDAARVNINGAGTYEQVKDNLLKMKKAGISCSCLMVVNHSSIGKDFEYLRWFNDNDISLKINPVIDCGEVNGNDAIALKEGEYADYLIDLFQFVLDNNIEVSIQPIGNLFNASVGLGNLRECSYSGGCANKFLCIDYKGDVYPCGRFCDADKFCMGSVFDEQWDIYNSNGYRALMRFCNYLKDNCGECRYLSLCGGGCPAICDINRNKTNTLCRDNIKLFDFFRGEGVKMYRTYLNRKKAEDVKKLRSMREG